MLEGEHHVNRTLSLKQWTQICVNTSLLILLICCRSCYVLEYIFPCSQIQFCRLSGFFRNLIWRSVRSAQNLNEITRETTYSLINKQTTTRLKTKALLLYSVTKNQLYIFSIPSKITNKSVWQSGD